MMTPLIPKCVGGFNLGTRLHACPAYTHIHRGGGGGVVTVCQPRGVASKNFLFHNQRATAIGRRVDDLLRGIYLIYLSLTTMVVVYINEFLSVVCA